MLTETVQISVAVVNYDRESRIIRSVLKEAEALVHGKDEFVMGEPEYTFGWYFFDLTVSRNLLVKLVNLLGNEFLSIKGKNSEKKFLNWLTAKLRQLGCEARLDLTSELESSKFGLF